MNKLTILFLGLVVIISGCVSQQEVKLDSQCGNIDDQYKRDSCYSEIVKSETTSFANCIKEGKTQNNCNDENKKNNLIFVCGKIDDQKIRDLCYNTLVFIYDDVDICKSVIDKTSRNQCIMFKINLLSDCKFSTYLCRLENINVPLEYCNNIEDSDSKLFCEAVIAENSEKCDGIKYQSLSTKCIVAFDKFYSTFEYEKDGRKYTSNYLYTELQPAMEWIKNNLPKDSIVSAWWDYGHIIRGLGNVEAIVFTPSEEILNSVATSQILKYYFPPQDLPTLFKTSFAQSKSISDTQKYNTKKYGELSNNNDIKNVALILTTTNPEEAINLMKEYNSKYVLVTSSEYGKAYHLYQITGIPTELVNGSTLNKNSIFYKMLKLELVNGFERVYSDSSVVIYKIKIINERP
ncbi:hypothetical protein HY637_06185 [Candidatus Woesearchaeota archaeon]|nr:hypothetical protein [Candidatus Woesearchaeota archaeon]